MVMAGGRHSTTNILLTGSWWWKYSDFWRRPGYVLAYTLYYYLPDICLACMYMVIYSVWWKYGRRRRRAAMKKASNGKQAAWHSVSMYVMVMNMAEESERYICHLLLLLLKWKAYYIVPLCWNKSEKMAVLNDNGVKLCRYLLFKCLFIMQEGRKEKGGREGRRKWNERGLWEYSGVQVVFYSFSVSSTKL